MDATPPTSRMVPTLDLLVQVSTSTSPELTDCSVQWSVAVVSDTKLVVNPVTGSGKTEYNV